MRCALIFLLALAQLTASAATDRFQRARDEAILILGQDDAMAAVEFVASRPDALDSMSIFLLLTRELYWEHRNLPAAVTIGRAGVQFGLLEALRLPPDSELANLLRSEAKTLAYDVSSFCWPGWNETGIEIGDTELILGQDLAKTNLRLAISLNKGDLPMSRASWLIGAHHLAIEQNEAARRAFVEAAKFAIAADAKTDELLNRGYIYLSDMLIDPDNDGLAKEFEFVLQELSSSREGTPYVDQLRTARWVFLEVPIN